MIIHGFSFRKAKEFVKRMLVVNPDERANAEDLKKDPWLAGAGGDSELTGAIEGLKSFNARRKFRAAVTTVKAVNRAQRIISECKVLT
jgi:calcium/calmodulin-dependent protein kinase I